MKKVLLFLLLTALQEAIYALPFLTFKMQKSYDPTRVPITIYLTNPKEEIAAVEFNLKSMDLPPEAFLGNIDYNDYLEYYVEYGEGICEYSDTLRWSKNRGLVFYVGTMEFGRDAFYVAISNGVPFVGTEGPIITLYVNLSMRLTNEIYPIELFEWVCVAADGKGYYSDDVVRLQYTITDNGEVIPKEENPPLKFSVNYDGDGAVVVSNGEEKYSGDIVIPEVVTIDGTEYEVKSIGYAAFRDCKDLTSVIIPNTVTSIGGSAFYGCSALKTVEIPSSVEEIGGSAFYECSELTSVTIPSSVTRIGNLAFAGCTNLTSITIPNSVTSIGSSAFAGCTNLPVEGGVRYADTYVIGAVDGTQESYKVKEGTRFVGTGAFAISKMTSISLPSSIEYIGDYAFQGCSKMTSISLPSSIDHDHIGKNVFYGCTSLPVEGGIRYADTYVIEAVDKEQERYEIKEGTIFIGEKAFLECNMTSVSVPNSMKYIGTEAFKGCGKMQSINLPDEITYIGPCAFYGDSALASVNIPKTLTSLSREMFRDCKSLTSIEIPNSITGLGEQSSESSVFWGCSNLISVIIPESVTIIDLGTFSECTSLKEITLPKNLYRIGFHAFWGCTSLESIVVPDSVESIDGTAFYGCTNMKSATIPHSTSGVNGYISNSVFKDTPTLTDLYINVHNLSVNQYSYLREVPEGLTLHYLVGGKAVGSTLVIPDSVQTLGSNIFQNCTEITSIIVNSSTISGRTAFEGCSNVTNFYLLDKQPKSFMGGYVWQNLFNNENVTLYVTQGNLEKVRNEDLYPWSRFKEIIELHKQQEDVNGDEKMNTADVVAVYSHIVNGNESGIKSYYADANLDGIVNTADVVAIYNAIINGVGSDSDSPKFLHNNYPQDNTEE